MIVYYLELAELYRGELKDRYVTKQREVFTEVLNGDSDERLEVFTT